jgi:hypothetical protein
MKKRSEIREDSDRLVAQLRIHIDGLDAVCDALSENLVAGDHDTKMAYTAVFTYLMTEMFPISEKTTRLRDIVMAENTRGGKSDKSS